MGTDRTETTTADAAALTHAEAWILANIPASERAELVAAIDAGAAGAGSTETVAAARTPLEIRTAMGEVMQRARLSASREESLACARDYDVLVKAHPWVSDQVPFDWQGMFRDRLAAADSECSYLEYRGEVS